tara:strand:- start:6 stop:263 length:258 start_codon:yes stop_codon:yes gene_type:complete
MKEENIFKLVKTELIKKKIIKKNDLKKEIEKINIFSNENVDSLLLMNLIGYFEKKFRVDFSNPFFVKSKNQTITKICEYIFIKIK